MENKRRLLFHAGVHRNQKLIIYHKNIYIHRYMLNTNNITVVNGEHRAVPNYHSGKNNENNQEYNLITIKN